MADRNMAGQFYKYSTASETAQVTIAEGYTPALGDIVKNAGGSAQKIDPATDTTSDDIIWGVVNNITPVLIEAEFPSCTIAIQAKAGIYIPAANFGSTAPTAGSKAFGINIIDNADGDGNLIGSF